MTTNSQKISVVICTKDRPDNLEKCMDSILASDSLYMEIIVVDSSKTPFNIGKVRKIVEDRGGRYYYESRSGISFARNIGIENAKSDIAVFCDDDFIVREGWIKNLVKNHRDNSVACCTGRMISYRDDYISNLFEGSMSKDRGTRKRVFTKDNINFSSLLKNVRLITSRWLGDNAPVPWSIGFGYFSIRKSVTDVVGSFDETLGAGTPSLGGEEVDMFYRILRAGYKVVYEPNAVIYHDHRPNFEAVLKAAYDAGCSEGAFFRKYSRNDSYVVLFGLGAFLYHVFSMLGTVLELSTKSVRRVELERLKGFVVQIRR